MDKHFHNKELHFELANKASGNSKVLTKSLLLTSCFMVVEFFIAYISKSLTILSDAGHMFTDVMALSLSLFAINLSKKPSNNNFTFGYHRFQVISAFLNGISLLILSIYVIFESIVRFFEPIKLDGWMLVYVGFAGFIVNLIVLLVVSKGDHHNDVNMKSVILHVLSDMVGSLGASIAGIVILLTDFMLIDPILSIFISILFLNTTYRLLRNSIRILMEASPVIININELKNDILKSSNDIIKISDFHVWSITEDILALKARLTLSSLSNQINDIKNIKQILNSKYKISESTIEIDTE